MPTLVIHARGDQVVPVRGRPLRRRAHPGRAVRGARLARTTCCWRASRPGSASSEVVLEFAGVAPEARRRGRRAFAALSPREREILCPDHRGARQRGDRGAAGHQREDGAEPHLQASSTSWACGRARRRSSSRGTGASARDALRGPRRRGRRGGRGTRAIRGPAPDRRVLSSTTRRRTAPPAATSTCPSTCPRARRASTVAYAYDKAGGANVVDLGLFEPGPLDLGTARLPRLERRRARRRSPSARREATPGYWPGPLPAGRWNVMLGLYKVGPAPASTSRSPSRPPAGRRTPAPAHARPAAHRSRAAGARPGTAAASTCTRVHSDGELTVAEVSRAARARPGSTSSSSPTTTTPPTSSSRGGADGLLRIVGEEVTTPGGHASVWGLGGWRDYVDFRVLPGDPRIARPRARGAAPGARCSPSTTRARPAWAAAGSTRCPTGVTGHRDHQRQPRRDGERPSPSGTRCCSRAAASSAWARSDWHRGPRTVGRGQRARVGQRAVRPRPSSTGSARGRVVVMADGRTPPPLLVARAAARSRGGGRDACRGARARDVRLDVTLPVALVGGRVDLVADGAVSSRSRAEDAACGSSARPTDRYLRVHVYGADGAPRAVTNPVFLERAMTPLPAWRRRSCSPSPARSPKSSSRPSASGRPDAPIKVDGLGPAGLLAPGRRGPPSPRSSSDIMEDYARTHPDVQLEISAMPALEMHKAKLLLAASAGPPARHRVGGQLLDAAVPGRRARPAARPLLAGGGPRRLPALHHRHPLRRARARLRHLARHRLPAALLPQGPRARAARDVGRAARGRRAASPARRRSRATSTTRGAGKDRSSTTSRMFWAQGGELVDDGGRPIFGEPPHRAEAWWTCSPSCARPSSAAPRRSPVLSHNDYQQLTSAAIAGDAAMFLGGNWQLGDLRGRPPAGGVREVGRRAHPAEDRRHAGPPAPGAGCG